MTRRPTSNIRIAFTYERRGEFHQDVMTAPLGCTNTFNAETWFCANYPASRGYRCDAVWEQT